MAVETDMGTVRDVVGQCLSLRRDFNLNKVKADGESRSNWFYKNKHICFYACASSASWARNPGTLI